MVEDTSFFEHIRKGPCPSLAGYIEYNLRDRRFSNSKNGYVRRLDQALLKRVDKHIIEHASEKRGNSTLFITHPFYLMFTHGHKLSQEQFQEGGKLHADGYRTM